MDDRSATSSPLGDDTIDIEVTPEQLLGLSRYLGPAESVAPGRTAPGFRPQQRPGDGPATRIRHWHLTSVARMAPPTIAFIAFAWWSSAQFAMQPRHPRPPATAVAAAAVAISSSPMGPGALKPAVHVINPFDATEVFEFPGGTSDAESREKVAQILLQRARERQSRWESIRAAPGLGSAGMYRSPKAKSASYQRHALRRVS